MIVVVDASVLVAELLRRRGRELFAHRGLQCLVAEEQWEEARHELQKRVAVIVGQGRLSSEQGEKLLGVVHEFVQGDVIEVVPRTFYEHMEHAARRRVPRDPNDWAPVALALALNVAILTGDHDFLGCGCPTWTVETLTTELGPS
ncbi:MAG: PIN domain-containing protein [Actinomycetota bacterium]|nr:PIN domain-containing protein [Actinomycetota bacterium]